MSLLLLFNKSTTAPRIVNVSLGESLALGPLSIPGCTLWLDASDASTITTGVVTIVQTANVVDESSDVTVVFGTAPSDGNLLLCVSFPLKSATSNTGWELVDFDSLSQYNALICYKWAGASESTSQTPITNSSPENGIIVYEISGASNFSINGYAINQGSSASATYPPVTPSVAGCMAFTGIAITNNPSSTDYPLTPSGMTLDVNASFADTNYGGNDVFSWAHQANVTSGTAFSPSTSWTNAGNGYTAITVIVAPISGSVSQWNDKSGNGINLSQSTSGFQPTITKENNLTALSFNGANSQVLVNSAAVTTSKSVSMFVVGTAPWQSLGGSSYETFIKIGAGGDGYGFGAGSQNGLGGYGQGDFTVIEENVAWVNSSVNTPNGPLFLASTSLDAVSNIYFTLNGGTPNNSNAGGGPDNAPSANTSVGGDPNNSLRYLTGNICEIIVYPSVLSTTNRQIIEGYLAWKWGLQANLPNGHPYALQAPLHAVSDSLVSHKVASPTLVDTVTTSDSLTNQKISRTILSSATETSDSLAGHRELFRSLADSLTTSESIQVTSSHASGPIRFKYLNLSITPLISIPLSIQPSISIPLSINPIISTSLPIVETISVSLGIAPQISLGLGISED